VTRSILKFTSDGVGSVFATLPGSHSYPEGLAFDITGTLYAGIESDTGLGRIDRFTTAGVRSVFVSGGFDPIGLAFDAGGDLYIASYTDSRIEKVTPGGVLSIFADSADGLNKPRGLAFDSAGNLYVSNLGNSTVQRFTPDGVGAVFISSVLAAPSGLAFDSAGNLYVSNNGAIKKFTPGGVGSIFGGPVGQMQPEGLAFDSEGNLYAADWFGPPGSSKIRKYTPDGTGSIFADGNDGLEIPNYLAFTDDNGVPLPLANQRAIPEPGTLALLGLGLPALLGSRRFKRSL
jgi:DNA-binding beta-propeller fold protein YncE